MNAGLYKAMLGLKDFNFHSVPVEVLRRGLNFPDLVFGGNLGKENLKLLPGKLR